MLGEQTFQKIRRIVKTSDYSRIWREGQRYHTANFVIIVCSGSGTSRLGMTVSRKVGNAVCRNRLKRWIREFFRHYNNQLSRPADFSVIAKRRAGLLSHSQLDRELQTAFARLETEDNV